MFFNLRRENYHSQGNLKCHTVFTRDKNRQKASGAPTAHNAGVGALAASVTTQVTHAVCNRTLTENKSGDRTRKATEQSDLCCKELVSNKYSGPHLQSQQSEV